MAEIVNLKAYRTQVLEQKVFGAWNRRFRESFQEDTLLEDLSAKTLYALATPGDHSTYAYYELIMGVMALGPAAKFHYLDDAEKLMVVDRHLFLADQTRFELMFRLGWLSRYGGQSIRLIDLVEKYAKIKAVCSKQPPVLSENHPDFTRYEQLPASEKETFIRQLLSSALEAFKDCLQPS